VYDYLKRTVSNVSLRQWQVEEWLEYSLEPLGSAAEVSILDHGSGDGRNKRRLRNILGSRLDYVAVDIEDSAEALARPQDFEVISYDGRQLPFDSETFDAVLSVQVLEHCRYLDEVVAEMSRVCRPNGRIFGCTSNLEPFHSRSLWSITPYGLQEVFNSHSLELLALAPGIDGRTLLERSFTNDRSKYDVYFGTTSPLNEEIMNQGKKESISKTRMMMRMLRFSGHYFFCARKLPD